jgi:inorganic pyrophosphatase
MNHFRLECVHLHPWQDIDRGKNTPNEFIAVIEIPLGSNIKHELGKESGIRKRFNHA